MWAGKASWASQAGKEGQARMDRQARQDGAKDYPKMAGPVK